MSLRHVLAGLAVLPALAAPVAAHASTVDSASAPHPRKTHFDLQAHRGGIGMTTEESLEGFGKAMRLGVTTLELDTQITKDQKVVVNHDRQISAQKCADTAPVTAGDPMYPYVGKYIKDRARPSRPRLASCSSGGSSRRSTPPASRSRSPSSRSTGAR
ncbi:glycerophosphodiester phosphodiesterase family protein [Micromonospora sp. NPDC005254]|uniref:glycerophosphodiester phosphodiesterase family protein n=1 Tax=Micromonospora sp. NPDC005254 TaxID=3364229 RepID=UPI0036BAAED1